MPLISFDEHNKINPANIQHVSVVPDEQRGVHTVSVYLHDTWLTRDFKSAGAASSAVKRLSDGIDLDVDAPDEG